MKGCIRTLVVSLVLLLAVGVGTARADILTPPSGQPSLTQSQSSTQSQDAANTIDQDATSQAISAPGVQSNVNAPVRVASDGDNGDVNQSNQSKAVSEAENNNTSAQTQTTVRSPDLTVTKSVFPIPVGTAAAGSSVQYLITISNNGNAAR